MKKYREITQGDLLMLEINRQLDRQRRQQFNAFFGSMIVFGLLLMILSLALLELERESYRYEGGFSRGHGDTAEVYR